jgi:hypothetical protein
MMINENRPPQDDEGFDTGDHEVATVQLSQADLGRHQMIEQGKRISFLENHFTILEKRLDDELRSVRRLRKLMAAWISDV